MIAYKVYQKNYKFKKTDLIGVLTERRNDLRKMIVARSGLRWARFTFGGVVNDRHAVFVVPKELDLLEPINKFRK